MGVSDVQLFCEFMLLRLSGFIRWCVLGGFKVGSRFRLICSMGRVCGMC